MSVQLSDLALFAAKGAQAGFLSSGNPITSTFFAATTSAQLAGVISDGTGTGSLVFNTSPTFVTPTLGAATATSLTTGSLTITGTLTGTLQQRNGSGPYGSILLPGEGYEDTTNNLYYQGNGSTNTLIGGALFLRSTGFPTAGSNLGGTGIPGASGAQALDFSVLMGGGNGGNNATTGSFNGGAGGKLGPASQTVPIKIIGGSGGAAGTGGNGGAGGNIAGLTGDGECLYILGGSGGAGGNAGAGGAGGIAGSAISAIGGMGGNGGASAGGNGGNVLPGNSILLLRGGNGANGSNAGAGGNGGNIGNSVINCEGGTGGTGGSTSGAGADGGSISSPIFNISCGNAGTGGTTVSGGSGGGMNSPFAVLQLGNGGNSSGTFTGGAGGSSNAETFFFLVGNGANAGTGGNGGAGANLNSALVSGSGNGGAGSTGAAGGAGASNGTITTSGGNGGAASGSTAGANGGAGGSITLTGTNASGATAGIAGGSLTLSNSVNTITTSEATPHTITIPSGANDTLVTLSGTQALANKTYEGNTILTGTGVIGAPVFTFKGSGASPDTVTNSTTFLTVTGCTTPTLAVGTYMVDGLCQIYSTGGASTSKFQILASAAVATIGQARGIGGQNTIEMSYSYCASSTTNIGEVSLNSTANGSSMVWQGVIIVTTPCTLSWQFAQNVAAAPNKICYPTDAYFNVTRLQ